MYHLSPFSLHGVLLAKLILDDILIVEIANLSHSYFVYIILN